MGEPKQLVRIGGKRLLERAVEACRASELSPIIVVLGSQAERIQRECDLADVQVVTNDRWAQGMSNSLQSGIVAASAAGADAAVVVSGDMPFVSGDHLRALATMSANLGSNVASWYDGLFGIPACFTQASFAAILQLKGDTGARKLLIDAPVVELENGTDVDTPEDLRAATSSLPMEKS